MSVQQQDVEEGEAWGVAQGERADRQRVIAHLRSEAFEQINVVETMLKFEHHAELRDGWSRWSTIAAHASRAAHALEFAERLEGEAHEEDRDNAADE
jgi:hypothetical protein